MIKRRLHPGPARRSACAAFAAGVFLILLPLHTAATITVEGIEIDNRTRVGRTLFEYEMFANIRNDGPAADEVRAVVTSTNPKLVVVEDDVEFGAVTSGAQAKSIDTFRLRVDRRFEFSLSDLDFSFEFANREVIEAESVATGLNVGNDVPGFTGTGFVEMTADASIRFPVEVPAEMHGVYQMKLRYALPDGSTPTDLMITIDGIPVLPDLELTPGAFGRWATKQIHRKLTVGFHEIEVQTVAVGPGILALLDSLTFTMTPPDQDRFLTFPVRANETFFAGSESNTLAYYTTTDPAGERATFEQFLERNGFTSGGTNTFDESAPDSAHATYQNVADLNLGRDMYVKRASNGDVASYVQNYGSADDAVTQTNLIATVAMEYRAPDDDPASPKFTVFYVYDQDGNRISKIDLDGRGAKFVPTLCNACHGGKPKRHSGLVYQDEGDTNAKWILWDLDNFGYSASKPRASQQAQFRKLNRLTLCTNPSSANILLARGWYDDPGASCTSVASNTFDGDFVPTGWAGHESLYLGVVAPSCRSCHAQRGSYNVRGQIPVLHGPKEQSLEFNSFSAFAGYQDEIERMIYDEGVMPAAKQTFDRFWQSNQPVILDNALYGGTAHVDPPADKYPGAARFDFGDRRKPGRPIVAGAGARLFAPGFPFDTHVNEDVVPGDRARLNALPSQFAETTRWFLDSGPTTPAVFPSLDPVTTFVPDPLGSDIAGAGSDPYILRLSITNSLASYNDIILIQQWSNSNRERIVFTDDNPATVDIFDLLNEISSSAGSCFNCHANNSVNAEADSIYNLRDTSFHTDPDARRFAFDQVVSRIDCRHPESSLIVAKPSGYHHGGGTLSGFAFGQQNWERLRRWAIEGARYGDGVTAGCP